MRNYICLGLTLTAFAACASTQQDQDGVDDSFVTSGKADGGLSSAEAAAVLRVANESSLATLKSDVGLPARTANRIVDARANRPFQTLAELDAVPYVGPVALDELLAYAEDRGYIASSDPFAPDSAGKDIATYDDMVGLLPTGERFGKLGRFDVLEQHRTCNSSTCAAWKDTTSLTFTTILNGGPSGKQVFTTLPLAGDVYLMETSTNPKAAVYLELQGDPDADGNRLFINCYVGPFTGDSSRAVLNARGLQTCSTSVTQFDEVEIERTGSGPALDRLWGLQIADAGIDWAGQAPTDLGYVTTSELALVANQSADYYKQTSRIAITADFTRP